MRVSLHAEQSDSDTVLITVVGTLEHDNAEQIPGTVSAALTRWKPRRVVLDVGAVDRVDSGGIAALLAAGRAAAAHRATLSLTNPGDALYRHLQECGIADLLYPC